MIRALHHGLKIPAEVLIEGPKRPTKSPPLQPPPPARNGRKVTAIPKGVEPARPPVVSYRFGLGRVFEIDRASGSEKGCSAKATEAEAGQRPVPPEINAGPAPFLAPSQSTSDGLVYFENTA